MGTTEICMTCSQEIALIQGTFLPNFREMEEMLPMLPKMQTYKSFKKMDGVASRNLHLVSYPFSAAILLIMYKASPSDKGSDHATRLIILGTKLSSVYL